MSIKKNAGSIAVFILLFVISFIFIIPFIWTMLTSLKPDEEIYSSVLAFLPVNPYLGHYTGIFTKLGNFFKYFSNSVVVSFWSVLFNVLFAATLGYSFSKFQYWGRDLFLGFVLLIITLPYVIYLIPIYIMQSRFDLIDTRLGLILPYIATNLPMSVFIMRGQFNGVPNEMMEAARIDGAVADLQPCDAAHRKAWNRHGYHHDIYLSVGRVYIRQNPVHHGKIPDPCSRHHLPAG